MPERNDENEQLRRVALQNAAEIQQARRRVEEELRQQTEWLRVMLASIGDAVISTDADGRVTFLNAVAESLTGWSQLEAKGKPLTEVFRIFNEETGHPAENPALRALREGLIVGLANHTVLLRKDGEKRPIDDSAAPIRTEGGSLVGSVLVFRDISQRRQSEMALRRSERTLSDFFENANVGLTLLSPDGVVVRANPAQLELLGYEAEEYVGRRAADFHADPQSLETLLERVRRGEAVRSLGAQLRKRDGSPCDVLINASGMLEGGNLIYARCFTLDVTERRLVHEAQTRLAAIVETSDDAIVSKTLDGVIQSWNPGAERIFGYTAAEAVGKSIELIIPPELRDEERMILQRLRSGERIDHFETVRIVKDGRRIDVSLSVSPIKDASGRIIGAAKVGRDISERKRGERERDALLASERHARAEAERASRLKEDFLATLSHELRTPLSAIMGWAHILRKKPPTPETLHEGLAVIERNARVQAQLIGDLLDMSRIISGKMRLKVERVELPVVIEAALDSVRQAAEAKGVRLETVLGTIGGPVEGDPARLQQVVWNLLSNAVKFTPRGGRVQVVLRRADSRVEITVSDTGRGMHPNFLPHAFERFRQADSSAAREYGGLGLGLSIVKQLVELHGGRISVTSEGEGKGCTFVVELPVTAIHTFHDRETALQPMPPPVPAVAPSLAGLTVLVLDDERDARELVRRVLEDSDARVILTSTADDAVAAVRDYRPDVIVADIGMPGRDGYAFMEALRRDGVRTPAAALTAFARSQDRTRALQAGFQTHIAKPVEPVELVAAVAALSHTAPQ